MSGSRLTSRATEVWVLLNLKLAFLLIAGVSMCGASSSSSAKDLTKLADLLTAPFLAQQIAHACLAHNPRFHAETAGPKGDINVYAQSVKDQVSAPLERGDVVFVLKSAADAAIATARAQIRSFAAPTESEEAQRFASWCERTAKPFVKGVIREYETGQDALARAVAEAVKN